MTATHSDLQALKITNNVNNSTEVPQINPQKVETGTNGWLKASKRDPAPTLVVKLLRGLQKQGKFRTSPCFPVLKSLTSKAWGLPLKRSLVNKFPHQRKP